MDAYREPEPTPAVPVTFIAQVEWICGWRWFGLMRLKLAITGLSWSIYLVSIGNRDFTVLGGRR